MTAFQITDFPFLRHKANIYYLIRLKTGIYVLFLSEGRTNLLNCFNMATS